MAPTLWNQGVELMVYGMGTVFVFLFLLIIMTSLMSTLVQRFIKPDTTATVATAGTMPTAATDDQRIAVISAAIHKYRSRHKR